MAMRVLLLTTALLLLAVGCGADEQGFADVSVDGEVLAATIPTKAPQSKLEYSFEHSLGYALPFVSRGKAEVRVKGGKLGRVKFQPELMLEGKDREAFQQLVESDGLYRLRLRSSTGAYVMTAIRACELVMSGFKEELKIMVDGGAIANTNMSQELLPMPNALSLDYRVPTSQFKKSCAKEAAKYASVPALRFQTAATIVRAEVGQALAVQPNEGAAATGAPPPGVPPSMVRSADGKGEGGGGGGSGGGGPQSQSFIRRYWYIILPLVLMVMTPAAPEEGQGGGQGAAPAAPAAASR